MGAINNFLDNIEYGYNYLSISLDPRFFLILQLFVFAILIVMIALIIFMFYNTLSKKNFIVLNLAKYNTSEHPINKKLMALLFYFIEHILIMPILILVWYIALSIILWLLVPDRSISQLLILSGALVMAIRILAYTNEEISRELSKLFPFIAVSIYLLNPNIFETFNFFAKLKELPVFFGNIIYFLIAILVFEIILKISYTANELASGKEAVGDNA